MCDVYKPSRCNNAPRSVEPAGSASYSSTIRALYSEVYRRLVADEHARMAPTKPLEEAA
jgi:hypothetical protein